MADAVLEATPADVVIEPEVTETDTALAALEKELLGDPKPATEAPVVPAAEAPKAEKTIDDLLGEIEEPKPADKPAESVLSPEQKQVLDVFPNAQEATQALNIANGYIAFTNTLAKGEYANTEAMLDKWNPEATEGLREYFFDKYVRQGNNEWVNRWIAEKEGKSEEHKEVRALKDQIGKISKQLEARRTEETTQAQSAYQQQTVTGFVNHVESLFKTIGADETDKQIIWPLVNAQVSGNQAVRDALNRRDYKAVNTIFKTVSKTYFGKTKTAGESRAVKQEAQAQHKPVVQAGAMQELATTAEPTGKEMAGPKGDAWLDQGLARLAKTFRKK